MPPAPTPQHLVAPRDDTTTYGGRTTPRAATEHAGAGRIPRRPHRGAVNRSGGRSLNQRWAPEPAGPQIHAQRHERLAGVQEVEVSALDRRLALHHQRLVRSPGEERAAVLHRLHGPCRAIDLLGDAPAQRRKAGRRRERLRLDAGTRRASRAARAAPRPGRPANPGGAGPGRSARRRRPARRSPGRSAPRRPAGRSRPRGSPPPPGPSGAARRRTRRPVPRRARATRRRGLRSRGARQLARARSAAVNAGTTSKRSPTT